MIRFILILYFIPFIALAQKKIPYSDLVVSENIKRLHVQDPYNGIDNEYFFDREGYMVQFVSITEIVLNHKQIFKKIMEYDSDNLIVNEKHFYNDTLNYIINYKYADKFLVLETKVNSKNDSIVEQVVYEYENEKLVSKVSSTGEKEIISYQDIGMMTETKIFYGDELEYVSRNYIDSTYQLTENYVIENSKEKFLDSHYEIYNDSGMAKSSLYFDSVGYSETTYKYEGNILEYTKYNSKSSIIDSFYDNKGNIIKEFYGNNDKESIVYKNKYNIYGDLKKVTAYKNGKVLYKKKYILKYY